MRVVTRYKELEAFVSHDLRGERLVYMLNSAPLDFRPQGQLGPIETGNHADMTVLGSQVLQELLPPYRPILTVIGGEIVYDLPVLRVDKRDCETKEMRGVKRI